MKFKQIAADRLVSDCGEYEVTKTVRKGIPVYQLWCRGHWMSQCASGIEAQRLAKAHRESRA